MGGPIRLRKHRVKGLNSHFENIQIKCCCCVVVVVVFRKKVITSGENISSLIDDRR